LFGASSEQREEQFVERREVVLHETTRHARSRREHAVRHRRVTLFEHQLFGAVEQQRARLRRIGTDTLYTRTTHDCNLGL
jgi:hypothetical protein